MPEERLDRHHLCARFSHLRGEGVTERVAAGHEPGRMGLACHLLGDGLDGEWPLPSFLVPEDVISRDRGWP
jgi:hypothetical protein